MRNIDFTAKVWSEFWTKLRNRTYTHPVDNALWPLLRYDLDITDEWQMQIEHYVR